MPYIKRERRIELEMIIQESLRHVKDMNAGDFNYLVSTIAKYYISSKGESYQAYNDILGALEGIKLEMYRRKVAPYEDLKIEQNGDI